MPRRTERSNHREHGDSLRDLKLSEVEAATGLSRPTLYRRLQEGKLVGRKLDNGSWRIHRAEVERILAEPSADSGG